jgi:hypothetical protein
MQIFRDLLNAEQSKGHTTVDGRRMDFCR